MMWANHLLSIGGSKFTGLQNTGLTRTIIQNWEIRQKGGSHIFSLLYKKKTRYFPEKLFNFSHQPLLIKGARFSKVAMTW